MPAPCRRLDSAPALLTPERCVVVCAVRGDARRMYWNDQRLAWNPDDFDGIDSLTFFSDTIWTPDATIYEKVGGVDSLDATSSHVAKVQADGEVATSISRA